MLVLSRKVNEKILIPGLGIEISVVAIKGGKVRLGIVAPTEITIQRQEISNRAPLCGVLEEVT